MARRRTRSNPSDVPAIAGYRDLAIVAYGANAVVYRAHQERFDRTVAIKILNVGLAGADSQNAFLRECATMGRLSSHPNIVTVLDSGFTSDERPYLAMDYYERGSLALRVEGGGRHSLVEVLRSGVKISGALETAHRAGVLHCDVKPHNILESRFGEPALGDFGIATVQPRNDVGATVGSLTVEYAAPDVLESRPVTPACDVYSLACSLHYLLVGRVPFAEVAGESLPARARRIRYQPIADRSELGVLVGLLRRATATDAGGRSMSAERFGRDLQALQQQCGFSATDLPIAGANTDREPGPELVIRLGRPKIVVRDEPAVFERPQNPTDV